MTERSAPPEHHNPEAWMASAVVHLHLRVSHPELTRSLAVSQVDLDNARASETLSRREQSEVFLERMLADPKVQLVMLADGVAEAQMRHLYVTPRAPQTSGDVLGQKIED